MKAKYLKLMMTLIMVLALGFILAGCGDDSTSADNGKKTGTIEEDADKDNDDNNDADEPGDDDTDESADDVDREAGIGEYIEDETWKISLLNAKQYDEIADDYYSDVPEDGKVYLALFFEVENVSDEDEFFNMFYFDCYVDSYSVSETMTINDPEGSSSVTGDVAAGKKKEGYVIWEVPADWEEFEFNYSEWTLTDSNAKSTFVVTKDDIS